jgi:transcription elongation factor GreA
LRLETPPMSDRTVYLTTEGFARLRDELRHLTNVRRPAVLGRLRLARESSEVTEHFEYEEAKLERAYVEARIQELERMLAEASLIAEAPAREYVTLGSRVRVRDRDGSVETYVVVGSAEAEPRAGRVSNQSPIGRALLGKRVGSRCVVVAPAGSFTLDVLAIE